MPRRKRSYERIVLPDPVFNQVVVTKLVNQVMYDGKKGLAQNIVYSAFDKVEKTAKDSAINVFLVALENVKPVLETKARRVGGATYQVPLEIREERRQTLAIRWLVQCARKRGERGFINRLAGEILDAADKKGGAFKKKEDMHKVAESNKAFAHFKF